jgi:hypothetical protein
VGAAQREVLRHEIAFADEVVLLDLHRAEIVLDDAQDQGQTVAPLGSGGVVHHVFGDKVVEHGLVARLLTAEHLFDNVLRASRTHDNQHATRAQAAINIDDRRRRGDEGIALRPANL